MTKNRRRAVDTSVLATHDVEVTLPMSKKYVSGNPLSRVMIGSFMRTLVSLIVALRPRRTLDVGCGEGLVSRQLAALWQDVPIIGLDLQLELLKVASELVPQTKLVGGSIYELPFPDRLYDLVVCTEVLEHLKDPDAALVEISRVGHKWYVLSVPNEPWWRVANMARGRYLSDWGNTPGHLNHWRPQAFEKLVARYFEIVAIRKPFPWTIVLGRARDQDT